MRHRCVHDGGVSLRSSRLRCSPWRRERRHASPSPRRVDIKAIRDKLIRARGRRRWDLLSWQPGSDALVLWYSVGNGKPLYEQIIVGRTAQDGDCVEPRHVGASRSPSTARRRSRRKDDGTFERWCGDEDDTVGL